MFSHVFLQFVVCICKTTRWMYSIFAWDHTVMIPIHLGLFGQLSRACNLIILYKTFQHFISHMCGCVCVCVQMNAIQVAMILSFYKKKCWRFANLSMQIPYTHTAFKNKLTKTSRQFGWQLIWKIYMPKIYLQYK